MGLIEAFRMALSSLRSNKLRAALTLLGMVIGVFAIIVAVTAVQVIETGFTSTIQSFGSTTFTLESQGAVQVQGGRETYRRENLTYEQVERLMERAELPTAISPVLGLWMVSARYGARTTDPIVNLIASNEHWAVNKNYTVEEGRFIVPADVQFGRPVVIIGSELEEELFPNERAVGKDILLDGLRYNVVGVLEEKGEAFGQSQDMVAIIPITRAIDAYGASQRDLDVDIRAPTVELLPATVDEVIGHMRVIRRVRLGEDNNFEIETNEALIEEVQGFTSVLVLGGAGIGLITLLAAGVGIMNIMLVSVTERTREIGVRKAIGARRGDVLRQFLYEAIFLCQIGGIVGILFGAGVGNLLALQFETAFVFPWTWAFIAVGGVTLIALVFGVYPAVKAARLDPIEALRYE